MGAAKRGYRQSARAQSAAATAHRVIAAATALLTERWYDDVTLADIAARAGVSEKTVLRRFGSKEILARSFFLEAGRQNAALRSRVTPGDVDGALHTIVAMYEEMGDTIVRYLSLEQRIPTVAEVIDAGRAMHREWVERVFDPLLGSRRARRRTAISLLVVATDVYTWKLLRRDAGHSRASTEQSMRRLARAALASLAQENDG